MKFCFPQTLHRYRRTPLPGLPLTANAQCVVWEGTTRYLEQVIHLLKRWTRDLISRTGTKIKTPDTQPFPSHSLPLWVRAIQCQENALLWQPQRRLRGGALNPDERQHQTSFKQLNSFWSVSKQHILFGKFTWEQQNTNCLRLLPQHLQCSTSAWMMSSICLALLKCHLYIFRNNRDNLKSTYTLSCFSKSLKAIFHCTCFTSISSMDETMSLPLVHSSSQLLLSSLKLWLF